MKYRYRAISDGQEETRGILEAENQMQAAARIREKGELILELEPVHPWLDVLTEDIYVTGIKDRELAVFSSQFAAALKAGISVEKTLLLLGGQAENRRWRKCLTKTAQFVREGGSLADGFMEAESDGFPAAFLEIVRGGEHSGRLIEGFENLSAYYERRYKARQKIGTALIYPCFVLGMAALVLNIYRWLGGAVHCGGVKGNGNGSASWHESTAFHFWIFTGVYSGSFAGYRFNYGWSDQLLED